MQEFMQELIAEYLQEFMQELIAEYSAEYSAVEYAQLVRTPFTHPAWLHYWRTPKLSDLSSLL